MPDKRQKKPPETLEALSQFDFHARIAETRGVALVTFTAPGCGGCRHLRTVMRQVRELRPGWSIFEIDAQRDQALTHEFEVFHLPSVILFFDGRFHCALEAEARPASIVETVRIALRQPALEAP